ncbi:hypothetical protein CO015_03250 [candidate division WWE3 bacterium CG_4_8_14_3_um_filter_42_11]|uniref:Uncharacterized protein n=1 Tax=candidate division WWE3 bacterium CG_4_8_14_3_um_filter_42_11 TaxID=1975076 RepID=A0A2M8G6M9_UNCKA|nr:MAG: hypothetical protein CO015_03250 [candidate division WWE3 bacterium CG_4_8_14_3_um_filter_42_11]
MGLISRPSPKNILAEQVQDTLGIIKTRAMLFPAAVVLFMAIKAITPLPISNLVFVVFGYFWVTTLLAWFLIEKWKNTPRIATALDIGKGLFLIEIVLGLFIIYYLIPAFVYLFGSSIWLVFFFYTFYSSAGTGGMAGYSYSRGFINSCFVLSCLCCGIVFFWECFGVAPTYEPLPFIAGFFYQRPIPSLVLFMSLIGVFFIARGFNSNIWEKFRRVNERVGQKTEELRELNQKLEEKVGERTRELEDAKAVLEVKIEARTRELRELAEGLEGEVERRTKEVYERMKELEKFQRLTIGREFKMVELKEEIKKLKEELEKYKGQRR